MTKLKKRAEDRKLRIFKHPPLAWYEREVKSDSIPFANTTAVATKQRQWTQADLAGALYLEIDMLGTGHSIAWKPAGKMSGHYTIAIGAPPQLLINLCLSLQIPIVDLSVDGFSLVERSRLLRYEWGNYPEYGGDPAAYLDACREAGASVTI